MLDKVHRSPPILRLPGPSQLYHPMGLTSPHLCRCRRVIRWRSAAETANRSLVIRLRRHRSGEMMTTVCSWDQTIPSSVPGSMVVSVGVAEVHGEEMGSCLPWAPLPERDLTLLGRALVPTPADLFLEAAAEGAGCLAQETRETLTQMT